MTANLPLGDHAGIFDHHCPEFTVRLFSLFRESISFLLLLRKWESAVIDDGLSSRMVSFFKLCLTLKNI